jgi:hypothetical protein
MVFSVLNLPPQGGRLFRLPTCMSLQDFAFNGGVLIEASSFAGTLQESG